MKQSGYSTNKWTDREVEQHWDRVASIYVKENNKVKEAHDQRFKESVKFLELNNDSKVLNITSRDCEANDYISNEQPAAIVINAEISAGLMKVASRIRPSARQVKLESYSKLPFHNNEFNRVLSLETLEHVSDPIAFLSELYRVSSQDARLVLSCPPATSEIPYRVYTFLFGGHGEGPHRFLPSKEVKDMLRKTGWEVVLHKGTVLLPAGPAQLQKAAEHLIEKYQHTFISELGIRQFYVCIKQ
jgi:SAM-dependent methyltransferase